jgi:O-antigen/teichoic acid export membrane protein
MLVLLLTGDDIFRVVFSSAWNEAGVYTQILCIWALIWFVSSPLHNLMQILEQQGFGLKFNIVNFLTRLSALCIGGLLGSARLALFLFAAAGIVVYGTVCVVLLKYAGVEISSFSKVILTQILWFLPVGAILIAMRVVELDPLAVILVAISAVGLYGLYLMKTDPQISGIFTQLRQKGDVVSE